MSGTYCIPLSGLKEGRHTFEFEINKEFFEQFEESEVKEGRLIASIQMDKMSTHLDLAITISGEVRICCDRCLEMFFQPVVCENRLLVKFGKTVEEIDPDILSLPIGEHELDLQQIIYEYIMLDLPIKRVHPNDINGKSTCDPEMLKKLEELIVDEDKETDPRWDKLKNLMKNN